MFSSYQIKIKVKSIRVSNDEIMKAFKEDKQIQESISKKTFFGEHYESMKNQDMHRQCSIDLRSAVVAIDDLIFENDSLYIVARQRSYLSRINPEDVVAVPRALSKDGVTIAILITFDIKWKSIP